MLIIAIVKIMFLQLDCNLSCERAEIDIQDIRWRWSNL